MERKTNWLAIAAAVVVAMLIGFLWYGVLFVNQWMAANGYVMEGDKVFKDGVEMSASPTPMIFNVVSMVVYALILNWLTSRAGATTWMSGATLGGAIGLMMAIGVHVSNMFAQRPSILSIVDGSYWLVLFAVMGAIVGGWRKRVVAA